MIAWGVLNRIRRMRRLRARVWSWYNLISSVLCHDYYSVCITLTYSPSSQWERRDISVFMKRLREYYRRRCWRLIYFWVAELQSRGAVHYHVIVFVPKGHVLPKPDERGWWTKGMTHIFSVKHFAAYLSKYLQKGIDGHLRFPRGLRIFGYGGLNEFEKSCFRCSFLSRRFWQFIYDLVGVFVVLRKTHRYVEVFTPRYGRVIIHYDTGVNRYACLDQGRCWS